MPASVDSFQEFQRVMETLNRRLMVKGTLPTDQPRRSLLIAALRECRNNMIRHAQAETLFLDLYTADEHIIAHITNDGIPPNREIVEGGGLSALRSRVEKIGGTMTVQSLPHFMLTIDLPGEEEAKT